MPRYTPKVLRDTNAAREWIDQFDAGDRSEAAFLIDSLTLISHTQFQNGLVELVKNMPRSHRRPIALFAAREPEKDPDTEVVREYFDESDFAKRPDAIRRGAGIGSEGIVAGIIRDISRKNHGKDFLDHPSIKSMIDSKVRQIFIVDDIIGSGQRITSFIKSFLNKKLKSWHSRKQISIYIVAYAGTETGIELVENLKYVEDVECAREIRKGSRAWSRAEYERAERICIKYAYKANRCAIPLGFEGSFSFLVFEHKCPNNVPPIFWSSCSEFNWKALFNPRAGQGFNVWPTPQDHAVRAKQLMQRMGQKKLAKGNWTAILSPEKVLVLAAIAKRIRKERILADIAGVTSAEVRDILKGFLSSRWITTQTRITEQGVKELDAVRKLDTNLTKSIRLNNAFYFPSSLRPDG